MLLLSLVAKRSCNSAPCFTRGGVNYNLYSPGERLGVTGAAETFALLCVPLFGFCAASASNECRRAPEDEYHHLRILLPITAPRVANISIGR